MVVAPLDRDSIDGIVFVVNATHKLSLPAYNSDTIETETSDDGGYCSSN